MLIWKTHLSNASWDQMLVALHGHPLQSAAWGEARKATDGIKDNRWVAYTPAGRPIFLVRFEERRILRLFKIAWVPKGPTYVDEALRPTIERAFLKKLKKSGFIFCFTFPAAHYIKQKKLRKKPQTMWIDFTIGRENVWKNINKKCQYHIRSAIKANMVVEKSYNEEDVKQFYQLCHTTSVRKKFNFPGSEALIKSLLQKNSDDNRAVESCLFVARHEGVILGGVFVMRCGNNVHYLWGAMDRVRTKLAVGKLTQWRVMEWAMSQGCIRYDLEGIDEKNNYGVYRFKKNLGGRAIPYLGTQVYALNFYARPLAIPFRIYLRGQ